MKPKQVKKLLLSEIKSVADRFNEFCVKYDRHFTRNRKLPFETVIGMKTYLPQWALTGSGTLPRETPQKHIPGYLL